jgi:hypothetical protein
LGGNVVREAQLGTDNELLTFSQKKNSKEFNTPPVFIPETKVLIVSNSHRDRMNMKRSSRSQVKRIKRIFFPGIHPQ